MLYSTLLYSTLLYFTLLYSTLLYFTLLYFTLDVVGGTPGGRALHGLFSKVACDMPPTGGLLGGYQGIAGDYAGIFPGDPSNNLGGLLDCHFIGLIILHMLSSKCIFFFFEIDLWRNCYIKNAVLFEENSILPLPERLESSGWQFLKVEVSQESPRNR